MNDLANIQLKLQRFEDTLDPAHPEAGLFGPQIIGYGEMSTVFTFSDPDLAGLAFKRMAIFQNAKEADLYQKDYYEYNQLLTNHSIRIPDYGSYIVAGKKRQLVLYLSQKLLQVDCIAHKKLHQLNTAQASRLFGAVLIEIEKVFIANVANEQSGIEIGFDVQLSNWWIADCESDQNNLPANIELSYIDTSTPLVRKNGQLQLDPELFLRICPASLVWIIRLFFLKDVVDRYFDLRLVLIDLIANLYKEKRIDLIDPFIDQANSFLQQTTAMIVRPKPIQRKEIDSYYKEDALIWKLFLALRRMERYIQNKLLHRQYDLILPGRIER